MQAVVKCNVGTFSQTRTKELSHQEVDEWSVRVYFALINFSSFQSKIFHTEENSTTLLSYLDK